MFSRNASSTVRNDGAQSVDRLCWCSSDGDGDGGGGGGGVNDNGGEQHSTTRLRRGTLAARENTAGVGRDKPNVETTIQTTTSVPAAVRGHDFQ